MQYTTSATKQQWSYAFQTPSWWPKFYIIMLYIETGRPPLYGFGNIINDVSATEEMPLAELFIYLLLYFNDVCCTYFINGFLTVERNIHVMTF